MSKRSTPRLPSASGKATAARQSRREEMTQLLADRKRRERRRAILVQAGIGAVVVALVLGITIAVLANRDGDGAPEAVPPGLTSEGSIRFGPSDTKVTVQVVEDFQCPACRQFETAFGAVLEDYRSNQDVAVEYRPIAFLDQASTTEYASRALNASMCVLADSGANAWATMHESLYAQQPPEGGAGLDDSTLVSLAAGAGADGDDVATCINDRRYDDWVQAHTEDVMASGVGGTPTVYVNGQQIEATNLEAAVDAARP